jgi:hypothetical protein
VPGATFESREGGPKVVGSKLANVYRIVGGRHQLVTLLVSRLLDGVNSDLISAIQCKIQTVVDFPCGGSNRELLCFWQFIERGLQIQPRSVRLH